MLNIPYSNVDQLPTTADRVLIVVNRHAGLGRSSDKAQQLASLLIARGFHVDILDDLAAAAASAERFSHSGKLRVVVGAGGDGTIHQLLNLVPSGVALAMLPLGTENLLAKYLGQQRGVKPLAHMITDGHVSRIDAGRANGRLFLLMASVGFDADVARRLAEKRRGNISHLTYVKPMIAAMRNYSFPILKIDLETSDGPRRIEACWCFAFNLPQYGFGLRFFSQADPTNGKLEVCTFRRGSLWQTLRYAAAVYLRRHQHLRDCEAIEAVRLTITSDEPVPYQLDGDPGSTLPLTLQSVPRRATLLVPTQRGL